MCLVSVMKGVVSKTLQSHFQNATGGVARGDGKLGCLSAPVMCVYMLVSAMWSMVMVMSINVQHEQSHTETIGLYPFRATSQRSV